MRIPSSELLSIQVKEKEEKESREGKTTFYKRKYLISSSLVWWSKMQKRNKKNFLCAFNDQFKQIFFVGGS